VTAPKAGLLVLLLAAGVYANSLGNGFAYDDNAVILLNPVVTSGDWEGALATPYHPDALEGSGLYRPLTTLSFTLEWMVSGDNPFWYHVLNLLAHAGVSVLVLFLLLAWAPPIPALFGAAVFAVHPVHVEAVANVVGRAELYSAFFFLLACLLYLRGASWTGWRRNLRLVGLGILYLLALGAKEIGVTLPLVLLLLEGFRPGLGEVRPVSFDGEGEPRTYRTSTWIRRVLAEDATYLLLFVILAAYLGQRAAVLGTLAGEVAAPVFQVLEPGQQLLTAVSLWWQYLRLLLFPLDLAADYAPGVLFPSETLDLGVGLGLLVLVGLGVALLKAIRSSPRRDLMAVGILWFVAVVLPVSNLFFPTGVLLAERTLYLPSVGLALVVAGLAMELARAKPHAKRVGLAFAVVALLGLGLRTVLRNPAWEDTYTVLETLNREHPESHLAFLNRGIGMERMGDLEGAGQEYAMALRLAPERYGTLTAAAGYYGRVGDWAQAESLLQRAMAMAPGRDDAYRLYAAQLLRQGLGREAHRVAAAGLSRAGFHPDLWGAVSESYLLKGDLEAALRARQAALSADSTAGHHWKRLADILEALGRDEEAETARGRGSGAGEDEAADGGSDLAGSEPPIEAERNPSNEGSGP